MHTIRLLAAAALLGLSSVAAASPTDTGLTAPTLAWDCARPGAPTYAEVRATFGVRDFHRAHRASLHLREVVKRACAGGADSLLLVARPGMQGDARFVASTAP
jgi:hypothetical protein